MIQKYQGIRIYDESDTIVMFLYLLKQHDKNPDYIVVSHLEGPFNELTGLF